MNRVKCASGATPKSVESHVEGLDSLLEGTAWLRDQPEPALGNDVTSDHAALMTRAYEANALIVEVLKGARELRLVWHQQFLISTHT